MHSQENNYAFIDSQNLNLGIQKLGWKLDYRNLGSTLPSNTASKLSPDIKNCSNLLKQTAKEKIWFMNELRGKLEYKRKSTA